MANNAETSREKPVLLLTRPAANSVRFAVQLDPSITAHADLIISPLMEIVPLPLPSEGLGMATAVFTSANGVLHGPAGNAGPAYCVGAETAKSATAKGWHVLDTGLNADDLVHRIPMDVKVPLVHFCGVHHRGDVAERLTKRGIPTKRCTVYEQKELSISETAKKAIIGERRVVVPLFSPRSAAYFAAQAQEASNVYAIAMSEAVAKEVGDMQHVKTLTLDKPVGKAMLRAVELLLTQDSLP